MKGWIIIIALVFTSCYETLSIEGFDKSDWQKPISCGDNRIPEANLLIANENKLLESNQNEITRLLGNPNEHELYSRNQKFFYYNLSPKCDSIPSKRLAIRFDALGRVNEVNIFQLIE